MIEESNIFSRDRAWKLSRLWKITLAYLIALIIAEALTTIIAPRVGMVLYGLILIALLLLAAVSVQRREYRFLVALALAPLIRLLSLAFPLTNFPTIYWYAVVGFPLFIATYMSARVAGFKRNMIGLQFSWRSLPVQLLIGLSGLAIGFLEYLILRPDPLVAELSWELIWLPALILLLFTGFLEELIFRGVMQTASIQVLGRLGIVFVAIVFAVLHMGYGSILDMIFVFAVAMIFGLLVQRFGSLLGVSISHGLTNISLYLIFPFLLASPLIQSSTPIALPSPENNAPQPAIQTTSNPNLSQTSTPNPSIILPLNPLFIPITGATSENENLNVLPESTPTLNEPTPTTCAHPSTWVEYIVQSGDTLSSLSTRYGVSVGAMLIANCMDNTNLITVGQQLFVPSNILPSTTPMPSLSSPPPTAPLPTQPSPDTPLPTSLPTATQTPPPTNLPTAMQTPSPTSFPSATEIFFPSATMAPTQKPTSIPIITNTPLPSPTTTPTEIPPTSGPTMVP